MIRHIVAIDNKRGIAKDGVQPWKLPTDEKYFKDMTKTYGGVVLMGRTTFEVMGHALSDRVNYVLSRDKTYLAKDAIVIHDVQECFAIHDDVWVIGGAKIYELTLEQADELYVTEIDADFDCDTYYPDFSRLFTLAKKGSVNTENGTEYTFNLYTPSPL